MVDRLKKRIVELEAGEEVSVKDIKSLLTDEQVKAIDDAWAAQQQLRNQSRARTEEEQKALGWKTKREVRLDVFRKALEDAKLGLVDAFTKLQRDADIRQAKIYFTAIGKKLDEGKDKPQAKNWANNELTRAGLRRMDGVIVGYTSKRDKEVNEMEDSILAEIRNNMTAEELEQLELLEEHEKLQSKKHAIPKK